MMQFDFIPFMTKEMLHGNTHSAKWHAVLCDILPKYNIDTPDRVAAFVTQTAHESNNYKRLEENLSYSVKRLPVIFGRYFRDKDPADYARNPEKLANYVYMDTNRSRRGALGNVQDGDGYLFRGHGLIQLTGRNNYTAFGKTIGMTAEEAVTYVSTEEGAVESACWFWSHRKLNRPADDRNIARMTRIINGGTIGLKDRHDRYKKALVLLSTVGKGSKGNKVRQIQLALNITADGDFGPKTQRAVKRWQANNGLSQSGSVNDTTFKLLLDNL